MSSFTSIDLSTLPPPSIVEALNFETIFSAMLADLIARDPVFTALVESDPAYKILEVAAYRELLIRQRINDAARGVMLAYAIGSDLDNLAALFGVTRRVIDAGDALASPPRPAVNEPDKELRFRTQLSLEGLSTAGPEGAYLFWALSADPGVLDVSAVSPTPGNVVVSVMSRVGNGAASPALVAAVSAVLLNNEVRPLTDNVTVQSAAIVNFVVTGTIYTYPGPDSSVVLAQSRAALDVYLETVRGVGRDISVSGIYAALHQPGVQRVVLTAPTVDLVITPSQAGYCTAKTITYVGINE